MSKKEPTIKVSSNLYKRKSFNLRYNIYYAQYIKMFTLFISLFNIFYNYKLLF